MADWSPDGDTVIVTTLDRAVQSLYLHHLPTGETRKLETQDGEYRASYTPDGKHIYASWDEASHNPRLVELDPHTGAMRRTLLALPEAPAGRPMRSVTFGRTFEQKIWHDLGHWEIEDMVTAREFLLRE